MLKGKPSPGNRRLNVALVQHLPKLRDIDANLTAMQAVLENYPEADLVVFPELWLGGYTTTDIEPLAIKPEDERLQPLAACSKRLATAVIFGAAVEQAQGVTNAAVIIDSSGRWSDCYAKTCLFGGEPDAFIAGNERVIADIGGVKTGLMICFDVEFPEVARALARAGADLLVTISANMEPFGPDHRVFGIARAIENGCMHVYVNQIGQGETFRFAGGSMVVSPDGDLLADADEDEDAVVTACFTVPARSADRPNHLEHLRPQALQVRGGTG